MSEPRYVTTPSDPPGLACLDCGALVSDRPAHTRFHSILAGHAWALAVIKTRHLADHLHEKYDIPERIDSRKFDSWTHEALAEVLDDLGMGGTQG